MGIFDYKFLNAEKLNGFDNYKYVCVDNSPIAVYISHPFWNWFVNFYPKWLAPNVLTLSGAALVTLCYFFVLFLDYDLTANSFHSPPEKNLPEWVWLVCFFCTFAAHLLDGTDGKQARRTGASGPTGELFDHGLDSWSTMPFTLTIFSIFGLGDYSLTPVHLLGLLVSVQLVFIVTHWEKYNTGIFFLSWGYDASQYGLAILYLVRYLLGPRSFHFHVFGGLSFAQLLEFAFYICTALSYVMSLNNIYHAYFVTKTGKRANFYEFILPMFSPFLLFSVAFLWALKSPMDVINVSPRLFCWTMGAVFSNIACYLTINQMSSTRVEAVNRLLIIYVAIALAAVFGVFGMWELLVLRVSCAFFTIAHIYFGVCVVRQLCEHFHINAFNLDYLKDKNKVN